DGVGDVVERAGGLDVAVAVDALEGVDEHLRLDGEGVAPGGDAGAGEGDGDGAGAGVVEAVGLPLPPGHDEGRLADVLASVGEVAEDVLDGVVALEGMEAADDVPGVALALPVGDLLD